MEGEDPPVSKKLEAHGKVKRSEKKKRKNDDRVSGSTEKSMGISPFSCALHDESVTSVNSGLSPTTSIIERGPRKTDKIQVAGETQKSLKAPALLSENQALPTTCRVEKSYRGKMTEFLLTDLRPLAGKDWKELKWLLENKEGEETERGEEERREKRDERDEGEDEREDGEEKGEEEGKEEPTVLPHFQALQLTTLPHLKASSPHSYTPRQSSLKSLSLSNSSSPPLNPSVSNISPSFSTPPLMSSSSISTSSPSTSVPTPPPLPHLSPLLCSPQSAATSVSPSSHSPKLVSPPLISPTTIFSSHSASTTSTPSTAQYKPSPPQLLPHSSMPFLGHTPPPLPLPLPPPHLSTSYTPSPSQSLPHSSPPWPTLHNPSTQPQPIRSPPQLSTSYLPTHSPPTSQPSTLRLSTSRSSLPRPSTSPRSPSSPQPSSLPPSLNNRFEDCWDILMFVPEYVNPQFDEELQHDPLFDPRNWS